MQRAYTAGFAYLYCCFQVLSGSLHGLNENLQKYCFIMLCDMLLYNKI